MKILMESRRMTKLPPKEKVTCIMVVDIQEAAERILAEIKSEEFSRITPCCKFYTPDNSTAMNCRNCGQPKYIHLINH